MVEGRPRRYFVLTDQGHTLVGAEALRMRQAASVVTARILHPGSAFS
ncbi:hypothetical protein [Streptosporangium sp. H16]